MGDASRYAGVLRGAGREVCFRVLCTTTIPYRFSPVRGSFCIRGFGILGSEAGLGTKLSGFRCALSKRVGFAGPASVIQSYQQYPPLIRNFWLSIATFGC